MGVEAKDISEVSGHNEGSFFNVVVVTENFWDFGIHSFG